ncbi:MAG: polymer-forming cytoskeletal protein [Candidatus Krumholzibacteria bacterium]|jgi:cytoskeletal protein CcmA (bactofilin family)|nr:polymer-forming cytoskeletal protein [Candidatus Krumholzibacteria bacterium]
MKKSQSKGIAIFGKEGEKMITEGKMNSILGQGCTVKGTIDVKEGTLRIDGDFEGTINCPGTLVVGKDGSVKADISVTSAVIGGKVKGNIDAREKIELQAGSRLEGDIKTIRLVIDEGVFFEGSCKMSPDGKSHNQPAAIQQGMQGQDDKSKEKREHAGTWSR